MTEQEFWTTSTEVQTGTQMWVENIAANMEGVYMASETQTQAIQALSAKVDAVYAVAGAGAAAAGMLLGAMLWRLVILGKNQRRPW